MGAWVLPDCARQQMGRRRNALSFEMPLRQQVAGLLCFAGLDDDCDPNTPDPCIEGVVSPPPLAPFTPSPPPSPPTAPPLLDCLVPNYKIDEAKDATCRTNCDW